MKEYLFKFKKWPQRLVIMMLLIAAVDHVQAQQGLVSGTVTDGTTALANVSVAVVGTDKHTQTADDGGFTIQAAPGDELTFSHIGFRELNVAVSSGSQPMTVVLELADHVLDDVVVVGYGVQKKTSVTAAVSTLKGKSISSIPVSNLSNGLGGRMAGVITKQGSGEPGRDGANIYIRGISSTGANQPLMVVDGIPRSFQQLDPNAIETFTVLKDAAAVAPYGVAGANGVILVTTKRGSTGAPTLTYNGYVGIQNPVVLPEFVNSYQYATLRNLAAENEGLPPAYTDEELRKFQDGSDPDAYPTFKDIWGTLRNKNTILTQHNIEITGGSDRVKYYAGVGYQLQEGMWSTTNTQRFNLNFNLDAQVTNTTKVSFSLAGRNQNDLYPPVSTGRIFELIGYLHPLYGPLRYSNGMPGTFVTGSLFNDGYQKYNTFSVYSQLAIEQDISFIPGLKLKGTIAYDPSYLSNKLWLLPVHKASLDRSQTPYVITDGIWGQNKPSLRHAIDMTKQMTYQAGLDYSKSFGNHSIGALALFEAKSNDLVSLMAERRNFNLTIDEINMGSSSQADMSTGGASTTARQVGLVYRLTYDYGQKYLFEASGRYDGSYYFAADNRYGFFPAFSAGWRISEEPFLKNRINGLDNLKIRGSYGEVGALAGSPFQFMSTYSVRGTSYAFGSTAVQGIRERAEPNVNITWERAKKTDVGLEINLWQGLLNVEADYFYEKRSNMLVSPDVIVPAEYGVGLSQVNAGIMDNRGFEVSVGSRYQVSDDLLVSLNANLTYAKNRLLQVFESPATYDNPNRRLTGRSLGTQFGYQSLGFFNENDFETDGSLKSGIAVQPWGAVQPGDIRYKDMNKDGKINDDDLTVIGDPTAAPRIVYGFAPQINYKGWSLDMLFQGAGKTNWYYHASTIMPFWDTMLPYVQNFDYWTPENTDARFPRLTSAPTANNSQTSSFWMGNSSYLRLKSVTLSYTVPASLTRRLPLQQMRIYVAGQNVLTWTKLMNYDPEIGPNNSWIPNNAWGYPNQKAFSVGANITF